MADARKGARFARAAEPNARELFDALAKINELGERQFDGGKAFSRKLIDELIRRKWLEVRGRRLCRTPEGTWIAEGALNPANALPAIRRSRRG